MADPIQPVVGATARRWGTNIHRLPAGGRRIALTFDDGPSNETERLLDILDRLDVAATFFLCGLNVERRPGIARAAAEAGHAVGNHSYTHPKLLFCSPRRVREELTRTQRVMEDATGERPTLFRAPYGLRSPFLGPVQRDLGLRGVYWTVIANDWKWDAGRVARRLLNAADPGGILCLHDGHNVQETTDRSETLKAVQAVVPILKDQGYTFVRVPGS